jgi:hypothetical protein
MSAAIKKSGNGSLLGTVVRFNSRLFRNENEPVKIIALPRKAGEGGYPAAYPYYIVRFIDKKEWSVYPEEIGLKQ